MKISMPKCCAACDNWTFIARKVDAHNPCVDRWGDRPKTSRYGKCSVNKILVFMDQVCGKFETDENLIDVVEVPSTGRVLEPLQECLL